MILNNLPENETHIHFKPLFLCCSMSLGLFCTPHSTMRQNDGQKCIIWSSSQPLCPGYPSSTSLPLGEAEWGRLLSEGPHQITGFHPPTPLTRGSSFLLSLNNTHVHRSSHSCSNDTVLPWETINHSYSTLHKCCHVTDPVKRIGNLSVI